MLGLAYEVFAVTQSKSKPTPVTKKGTAVNQINQLLDDCTDEELNRLAAEIEQLLWERKLVAEA